MSSSEYPQNLYARLMTHVDASRGYPLWLPEPDNSLPENYRNDGLRIGDVGVVAEDGSFDVFFNICLPADHPLHQPHGVPANFHQVVLSDRDFRHFPSVDSAGRVVSTRSISHRTIRAGVAGNAIVTTAGLGLKYEFSSSSEEGAILVLPEGAGKTDLANNLIFRNEALKHAESWYHFAYFNLGRSDIRNDSLYLITGHHKTSSWSIAAFSDAGGDASLAANFTAGEVVNGNIGGAYSWQVTNSMHWRVGPEEGYNRNKRNQAVSIRGYKIAVREGRFASLLGLGGRVKVSSRLPRTKFNASRSMFLSRATSPRSGGQVEGSSSGESQLQSSRRPNWTANLRSIPSSLRRPFQSSRGSPTRIGATTMTTSEFGDEAESQMVSIQQPYSSPKVYHPSDVVNQLLLDSEPLANVAVTHDSEWMGAFQEESLIQEDKMIEHICSRFHVEYEDNGSGFAYLHKRADRPHQADETSTRGVDKKPEKPVSSDKLKTEIDRDGPLGSPEVSSHYHLPSSLGPPQITEEMDCACLEFKGSTKRRKLIVCIDGTSNSFGSKNTNVVELYSQIKKSDDQLTYYCSGIGTLAKPSLKSWSYLKQRLASYADQAIAWNLDQVLLAAYKWLANSYNDGDQIFLFGFSRGAYQVRLLAAMIHKVGLILPGNDEQIPFAFETCCALEGDGNREHADMFKKTFSRKDVRVHFIGVWDTVSSVGFLRNKPFPSATFGKEHTCFFRHALALDERRVKFLPEYFHEGQIKQSDNGQATEPRPAASGRVKEVWFAGSHSDVGGGNTRDVHLQSGSIPLLWMRKEAAIAGLELKGLETTWLMKDLNNTNVESLTGLWWLPEVFPLKRSKYRCSTLQGSVGGVAAVRLRQLPNLGNGRVILPGQKIHASVLFRHMYNPRARFLNDDEWLPEMMHFDDPKSPGRLSELNPGIWETDLFDDSTVRFLLRKISSHPEGGEDILGYIDQLVFMSRSSYGREAIQKVPDGLGMIRRLMQSTNTKVRLSGIVICCELGQFTQEWDVTFVTTMLKSDDASEQIRVCSALPSLVKDSQIRAKLFNEETMKILTKLCRTKDNDHLKRQCAQCLALLVVYDGVPALIVEIEAVNDIRDLLDDTHSPVAVSALELLTSLAADEIASPVLANTLLLPSMIRLAGKHDERIARAAVTAILALARSNNDTLRDQVEANRVPLLSVFNKMAQQTESMTLQQIGREAKNELWTQENFRAPIIAHWPWAN